MNIKTFSKKQITLIILDMNKQIVLISSFCNTEEKIDVLHENIINIKKQGFDVAVMSPIELPNKIISSSDYVFFTKENPILDWPVHSMYGWKIFNIGETSIRIWETYPDYGWAGLTHVKRLGEMFLPYPYETYAYIIYDSILTDEHYELIRKGHEGIVFPSKRGNDIWKVGLHLMIYNKEILKRLVERINLKDYLSYRDFDAFAYLHNHLVKPLQLDIAKEPVEDKIYFYEKTDILNHSKDEKIKYFISSPDEYQEEVKILFYDISESIEIILIVNENESIHIISHGSVVSTQLLKNEIQTIKIKYLNTEQDLTEKLKSIKNSAVEIKTK